MPERRSAADVIIVRAGRTAHGPEGLQRHQVRVALDRTGGATTPYSIILEPAERV
jgi:hypothetical protein